MKKRIALHMGVSALLTVAICFVVLMPLIASEKRFDYIFPALPVAILVAGFFTAIFASRLAERIVNYVNHIDFNKPDAGEYDELAPVIRKIKARRRELSAERADLKERENTLRMITGNMHEGLLLLDGDGKVLMANRSASDILGETAAEGRNIVQVCRDVLFLEKVRESQGGVHAEMLFRREGSIYSVFFNPTEEDDESIGVIIFFVDITEHYAAEAQRKEFSANVSHELKTPLTTISALAEMIEGGMAKPEDLRRFGGKIGAQSDRLISIINDIIKLSEFDEGDVAKEFSLFDLRALARSVAESLQQKTAKAEVSAEVPDGDPVFIVANRRMTDELLYNLMDNAITYNRPGGTVAVELGEDEKHYIIGVRDTGIGIAPEELEHVFERFYRVDKSRSKRTGGTGLGLSIVKHVAEYHGGRVEIESKEGEGTLVRCYMAKKRPASAIPIHRD